MSTEKTFDERLAIIANRFDARLRAVVTERDYARIVATNDRRRDDPACASHDYCDANVVMASAMHDVGESSDDAMIWTEAWDLWREMTTTAHHVATDGERSNGRTR